MPAGVEKQKVLDGRTPYGVDRKVDIDQRLHTL